MRSQKSEKSVKSVVEILVKFVRFVFRKKKGVAYEEFTILGCAVEGNSSSHHGGRHGADHDLMHGAWPILSLPHKKCPLPKKRGLFDARKGKKSRGHKGADPFEPLTIYFYTASPFALLDYLNLHRDSLFEFFSVRDDAYTAVRLTSNLLQLLKC